MPQARMPHLLLLLASISSHLFAVHAEADAFQLVGNGFCVNAKGRRLKLGPRPELHGQELQWTNVKVNAQGRAKQCEFQCRRLTDCIGYMTEDGKACATISRRDHNAAAGIAGTDKETRNFCWERVQALEIDSGCEVWSTWPDGRRERRECMIVAS